MASTAFAKETESPKHNSSSMTSGLNWYETVVTFISGAVAGAVSRTATAPFDRVKIIVQEGRYVKQPTPHPQLATSRSAPLRDTFRTVYEDGGLRAFWRGNGVNCLKAGPEFALVFSLRRIMTRWYDRKLEYERTLADKSHRYYSNIPRIVVDFSIGAFGGAAAQFMLYPLEVVKTRIVVSRSTEFQGGLMDVVREAYRCGGVAEFYKGIVPNMVGIFMYRGFEVGLYSTFRHQLMHFRMEKYNYTRSEAAPKPSETALIAMGSSIIAQTVTYPLNVVRTRLQTQGAIGRAVEYYGMMDCFQKIVRRRGPKVLFAGLSANYMKSVPAAAITFVVFEYLQSVVLGYDED